MRTLVFIIVIALVIVACILAIRFLMGRRPPP